MSATVVLTTGDASDTLTINGVLPAGIGASIGPLIGGPVGGTITVSLTGSATKGRIRSGAEPDPVLDCGRECDPGRPQHRRRRQ